MKGFFKFLIVLLIVGGIGFFVYKRIAMHGAGPQGGMPGGDMGAPPVDVAQVIGREVQLWHDFSGRLAAADTAEIRPRVSGVIEEIHFADGSLVKKGAPLFTIDRRQYAASAAQAQGALASAQAQAVLAQGEFTRADALYADKALSTREYEQRKNALAVASANVKAAEAALDLAQINLGYAVIKAPIAGRIGRAEITEGNLVEAGPAAPVLATIVAHSPIYADFDMDEASFLSFVHGAIDDAAGIPVKLGLASESGLPHEGRIGSFDNRLDPASGTLRVRAVFDNEDGVLVPGLFARIRVGSPAGEEAVLITDRAIGTDQNKKFVLVVGADNKVEYREIVPGEMVDGLRIVRSGLKPGETIIVNGLQRARPGTPVTPQPVPMAEGEAAPAATGTPAEAAPAEATPAAEAAPAAVPATDEAVPEPQEKSAPVPAPAPEPEAATGEPESITAPVIVDSPPVPAPIENPAALPPEEELQPVVREIKPQQDE